MNEELKMKDEFEPEVIYFQGFKYTTVQSPTTGRIWLDRNLEISGWGLDGDYFEFGETNCPDRFIVPSIDELDAELPNNLKSDIEWMDLPFAGYRDTNGSIYNRNDYTLLWSSTSESGSRAYRRILTANSCTVHRDTGNKQLGLSVRLIKKEI